jgi:gas vesicle protein
MDAARPPIAFKGNEEYNMNVNFDLRNLQEQAGENGEQVRKYAHKAALAYTGLWAMAYDSAKSGLEGSKELLDKAEKRGEEVETEFGKQYSKYYEQAMQEFHKLQERAGGVVDLEEVSKSVTNVVSDNAKAVQENVGKVMNKVGLPTRVDVPEVVIEVSVNGEEVAPPLPDYEELTAKELVAKFDDMTVEELQVIRAYEIGAKNRVTVLRDIDERLSEAVVA